MLAKTWKKIGLIILIIAFLWNIIKCHPYWTGNLRKDTTGGRADKFKKKYGIA